MIKTDLDLSNILRVCVDSLNKSTEQRVIFNKTECRYELIGNLARYTLYYNPLSLILTRDHIKHLRLRLKEYRPFRLVDLEDIAATYVQGNIINSNKIILQITLPIHYSFLVNVPFLNIKYEINAPTGVNALRRVIFFSDISGQYKGFKYNNSNRELLFSLLKSDINVFVKRISDAIFPE